MNKIGILGGGQLGRMMFQAAIGLNLDLHFMDKNEDTPVGSIACQFSSGDFTNYDDVMTFSKDKDIIGIEIEKVNLQALYDLERMGKIVHPAPRALEIIQDKGLQKEFYQSNSFPTSEFHFEANRVSILESIKSNKITFPFVQKARKDGYDGQGVAVIKGQEDLDKLMDVKSIIEPLVDIEKELAVIAVRNSDGQIMTYPCVEMAFDEDANLVKYLYSPAEVIQDVSEECKQIAKELIQTFDICGLLAVEFFYTKQGKVLINEVAPRPHNSGHHTIDAMSCCQFENQLRGISNLPLGSTKQHTPAAMINVLGEDGYVGVAKVDHLEAVMAVEDAHLHLYGKKMTKPKRKMGHINVLGTSKEEIESKIDTIQSTFKIIA